MSLLVFFVFFEIVVLLKTKKRNEDEGIEWEGGLMVCLLQ